jgi:predicted nucleic acid-binding protein
LEQLDSVKYAVSQTLKGLSKGFIMANSMSKMFPGYFKENAESHRTIWESAIFVFDTNILLNLYRYSVETKDEFLRVLESSKTRLWLPHQAAEEYLRNRHSVIGEQEKSYSDAISSIKSLESKFDNARQHPFLEPNSLIKLKEMFDSLNQELENNKAIHTERITSDEIQERLADIFDGKIGHSYDAKELEAILKDGEYRFAQLIPPGYKDASKSITKGNLQQECQKYGDLIVWTQVIDYAKENQKDVIFVTDDEKEDWWLEFKGKTISARPELIKEFKDKTSKSILMYKSDSFIRHANKYLDKNVSEKIVEEMKQVREQDYWLDSSFGKALSKYRPFYDLVFHIKGNFRVGEKLPSERDLADTVGWNRSVVREQLVRLESFGYISIEHGKSTVLKRDIPKIPSFPDDNRD